MNIRKNLLALVVLSSFAFSFSIQAVEPTYGAEFTLTNRKVYNADYSTVDAELVEVDANREAKEAMIKRLREVCKSRKCTVEMTKNHYGIEVGRVIYSDGFWFQVATDPGVIEIQTKPCTLKEWKKNQARVQRDIFDLGEEIGLKPNWNAGGGHIHIGASAFENDPLLLRNFMVDFFNHTEIPNGAMEEEPGQSLPFSELPVAKKKLFNKLLQQLDGKEITMDQFLNSVSKDIYSTYFSDLKREWHPKYVAFNIERMIDPAIPEGERTVEIRSIRTQLSADQFVKLTELFEKRMEFLKGLNRPIEFHNPKVPRLLKEKAAMFHDYISEAGLDPKDYEFILPKPWKKHFNEESAARCKNIWWKLAAE